MKGCVKSKQPKKGLNMKTILNIAIITVMMLVGSTAFAGHHYHGYGCMGSKWNMEEMDTDQDGRLSFEEFSRTQQERLRNGFDMIDENKDGVIGESEWRTFLEVHGMTKESKKQ